MMHLRMQENQNNIDSVKTLRSVMANVITGLRILMSAVLIFCPEESLTDDELLTEEAKPNQFCILSIS